MVEAPGESDPEKLKAVIGKTAKLTFQMVDDSVPPQEAAQGLAPPDAQLLPSEEGGALLVKRRSVVSGEMLTDARQEVEKYRAALTEFKKQPGVEVLPDGRIATVEGNYENRVSANVRAAGEATGYVRM